MVGMEAVDYREEAIIEDNITVALLIPKDFIGNYNMAAVNMYKVVMVQAIIIGINYRSYLSLLNK